MDDAIAKKEEVEMTLYQYMAVIIAIGALTVSLWNLYRGSQTAEAKKKEKEKMRIIGMYGAIIWRQTIAIRTACLNPAAGRPDDFLFISYKINAKRLENALDDAVRSGLLEKIIGKHQYAFEMYAGFIQCLSFIDTIKIDEPDMNRWLREPCVFGVLRLLQALLENHSYAIPPSQYEIIKESVEANNNIMWNPQVSDSP